MKEVVKVITAAVQPVQAFDVVAAFNDYPLFLDDHKKAEIISSEGSNLIVDFRIKIIREFEFLVRHTLTRPNKIEWIHLKSPFKRCSGCWSFAPFNEGKAVEITYRITLDPGFLIPGFIASSLIEVTLPATLDRFKKRIEQG